MKLIKSKQLRSMHATVAEYEHNWEKFEILWSYNTPEVCKKDWECILFKDTRKSQSTWRQIHKFSWLFKRDWLNHNTCTLEWFENHYWVCVTPYKFY